MKDSGNWGDRFGLFIIAAIVSVFAFATYWIVGGSLAPKEESGDLRTVREGGDYYLSVPLVEVAPRPSEEESWDSLDDSAPDPYVEIHWRGKKVFSSSTKSNTFVAVWSNAAIDLTDIAKSMGKTSIDEVIRAARVTIKSGEVVTFRVYDSDPLGKDDLIGEVQVPVEQLLVGDETRSFDGSLLRLVIRANDIRETPDLFK